jgi:hypothetical protein
MDAAGKIVETCRNQRRSTTMSGDEKQYQTIDDVWPISESAAARYPQPILDIKNTFVTIDGKHYKVADLLKKLVEHQK